MATLILLVLAAITAALFAVQNTAVVSLKLAGYHLQGIPIYLVILISILVGFLISGALSIFSSVSNSFKIHGKDSKIKEGKKTVADVTKHVHQLELENTQLKTELDKMPDEKSL